jgi:hypothetical protein
MINGWRFEHAFPTGTALAAVAAVVVLTSVAALLPARLARRLQHVTEGGAE